jgi:ankyrin repeat protein
VRGLHNYSPMHFAATQVNLEAIRYFLENGTPCTSAKSAIACLPLQLRTG